MRDTDSKDQECNIKMVCKMCRFEQCNVLFTI